jgi:hypothetical protein
MKSVLGRGRTIILALVLVAAGSGFLWLGLRGLVGGPVVATVTFTAMPVTSPTTPATPTATPPPTATEPILPPPPTASPAPARTVMPTPTPARLDDATVTVAPGMTASQISDEQPTNLEPTPEPSATATPAVPTTPTLKTGPVLPATVEPLPAAYAPSQRLGVCAAGPPVTQDQAARLGLGWYLDWSARAGRYRSAEVEYVPMIRLRDGKSVPDGQALLQAVDAQPGALWLIGNEPDVKWQDNTSAEDYARLYHDLYGQLKGRDPSCQVAIGGVSQPTPLRLRYLDRILEAYQAQYGEPMPVDVWNVHNFILREELDSWGVDIPPGMPDQAGRLREIADHDDLAVFRQQIVDFRQWMKERGQQDKPLVVTEYGILMPADYGFPPETVRQFMLATFDYFAAAADPALGDPADGFRLVQRWCWYGLADERYPTGNLLDAASGALTSLGEAFHDWAIAHR